MVRSLLEQVCTVIEIRRAVCNFDIAHEIVPHSRMVAKHIAGARVVSIVDITEINVAYSYRLLFFVYMAVLRVCEVLFIEQCFARVEATFFVRLLLGVFDFDYLSVRYIGFNKIQNLGVRSGDLFLFLVGWLAFLKS